MENNNFLEIRGKKISDNEIRQILEALESEEQEVQEDLQELKSSGKDLLKDW